MKIMLPLSQSDNRRLIYAPRLRRMILSPEYRAWKQEAVLLASRQRPKTPLLASFECQRPYTVKIYMQSKRTDQANFDKALRDALTEARIWEDDRWWYPVYTPCEIDKLKPRMEITII